MINKCKLAALKEDLENLLEKSIIGDKMLFYKEIYKHREEDKNKSIKDKYKDFKTKLLRLEFCNLEPNKQVKTGLKNQKNPKEYQEQQNTIASLIEEQK